MATIEKCSQCKLGPRYAVKEDSKVCARCQQGKTKPRLEDEENKLNDKDTYK